MKNQGIDDQQIISNLQQQGISPREIMQALNQVQIKNAVSAENYAQNSYSPQTQEIYSNEELPPQPQGEYYPEETYSQQQYQQPAAYSQDAYSGRFNDADTIIEISEQVFIEKSKASQKQLDKLEEFKTISESKIENISERLKKIENIIDKLQISILEKVGSYGSSLETIKKEMSMIEDSFGKVMKKSSATLEKSPKKRK